mmetsp:Transcript_31883/g.66535  ORF Transcript_31883/g.66535 Transcript_31883/m.66535 type:complete len:454 (-) Transcript_31883:68-1429(-)
MKKAMYLAPLLLIASVNGFAPHPRHQVNPLIESSYTSPLHASATLVAEKPKVQVSNKSGSSQNSKTNNNRNAPRKPQNNKAGGKTREDRNKAYMMRRWKSQQATAKKRQAQQEQEENPVKVVSAIGMSVGSQAPGMAGYSSSKNKGRTNVNNNMNGNMKGRQTTTEQEPMTPSKILAQAMSRGNDTPNGNNHMTMDSSSMARVSTHNNMKSKNKQTQPPKKPWAELQPGSTISGKVTKILPYGALVKTPYDIPGKTKGCALLHVSQITGQKIANLTDVLQVGQVIDNARVLSINRPEAKVQISLRPSGKRAVPLETLHVGDEIEGKVVRLKQYGAFIDVGCKRNALLHISRITLYKVNNLADHVNVGDTVKVRVIRVDSDAKNIAVSMLSSENDRFVDRRERQRDRMTLWQKVVQAQEGDESITDSIQQLLELDRVIWEDLDDSSGARKSLEV